MVKMEHDSRLDIVEIGRLAWQRGWVASNDGNIAIRLDRGRVMCTPTGVSKGMMHPEDMIIVDMQGRKLEGPALRTHAAFVHYRPS